MPERNNDLRPASLLSELTSERKMPLGIAADMQGAMHKRLGEERRKCWGGKASDKAEGRCDFGWKPRLTPRAGIWFVSTWQKSEKGKALSEIKVAGEVERFAEALSEMARGLVGERLSGGGWALVTTPKRRHKEWHFASEVCKAMSKRLGIPFYEDACESQSRERINADFRAKNMPGENNLLVIDDIVTTGSTFAAMERVLAGMGKNRIYLAGINNK